LHTSHAPEQAVLQQYPSTQKPDAQSELIRHCWPPLDRHTPFVQVWLPLQATVLVQLVPQVLFEFRYVSQPLVPLPSQLA